VPALQAEFAIRGYALAASWTCEFELSPALLAELGAIGQLDFALWAFHDFPRHAVERGLVEFLNSGETQCDGMNNDYLYPPGNPKFSLMGGRISVNVFLRDFDYLPFFALGVSHLFVPCYFTEHTDRTSRIRHLRREIRDFLIRGI
jgi:hypothetical protein